MDCLEVRLRTADGAGSIHVSLASISPQSHALLDREPCYWQDAWHLKPCLLLHKDSMKWKSVLIVSVLVVSGVFLGGHVSMSSLLPQNPTAVAVDPDLPVRVLDSGANSQIKADQVWPLGYDGSGVRLAVLDTGIDTSHPEFSGRIVLCHSELAAEPTCEDGNGHGTHVAGIAGARGANSNAKGVAPGVSLLIDKVANRTGNFEVSDLIAGIQWAVQNQARIISISAGKGPYLAGSNCDGVLPNLTEAVNNANAAGSLVVAAAGAWGGPNNKDLADAPGCISTVVAVGEVNNLDVRAPTSSYGDFMLDHGLMAPGTDIFSTLLNDGYHTLSGTSMATPMVSG